MSFILDGPVKSRHPVAKRGLGFCNSIKTLDSGRRPRIPRGFRRNDKKRAFGAFCETIILISLKNSQAVGTFTLTMSSTKKPISSFSRLSLPGTVVSVSQPTSSRNSL